MVICNGTVIDGTGRSAQPADVVIAGDRIVDVVQRVANTQGPKYEDEVLDATGYLVTPGFIDAHAHSDAYLILEPNAPSKLAQGITTEVNGQCGGSVVPRYGEARLSGDWVSLLGDRLTWHSLAEYRSCLEAVHPAINTVQFVGHNTLRSSVIGYAGVRATPEKLREMENLLAKTLDEGGWGLTTGLIYQPGKYADSAEVLALAKVTAARGGMYATHMRSEGDNIHQAIDEVLDLVKATGIRAEISHLKTSGRANWSKIDAVLEKMQRAVDTGLLLGSDRYPYCAAGTDLDVVFSDWAGEGAAVAEMARLADPTLRKRISLELDTSGRNWEDVMIGGTWCPETKPFSGQRIADILRKAVALPGCAKHPTAGELICAILALDGCRTGAFFFGMSEENLHKIYACDWIVPGSDASLRAPWGPLSNDYPHPRAYGTMPRFFRMVTGRLPHGEALCTREAAIARMTSVPAHRFGIQDRGEIRKGAFADICVWREEDFQDLATYDHPHQFAQGMEAVIVNGTLAYQAGRFTQAGTGRFLER